MYDSTKKLMKWKHTLKYTTSKKVIKNMEQCQSAMDLPKGKGSWIMSTVSKRDRKPSQLRLIFNKCHAKRTNSVFHFLQDPQKSNKKRKYPN